MSIRLKKNLILNFFCFFIINCFKIFAQEENIEITVYNQNLGLVKETRFIEFKKGENIIKWIDIASLIDPTSVKFKSLKNEFEVKIQEQNYEYDLVDDSKLLEKYIDKSIEIITKDNQVYNGSLLSFNQSQLLLTKDKIKGPIVMVTRENVRDIKFPELPEGLITKPTLLWNIFSIVNDKHLCELTYLTKGINWHVDYIVVVNDKNTKLDLVGWVTIDNQTGTSYKNAKLKLIAGDIHLIEPEYDRRNSIYLSEMQKKSLKFTEESLFEYHLYTLSQPTTIKDKQTKQINLLTNNNIPCNKIFTYNGIKDGKKVKVSLEFINSEKNGIGIPLPKGKIRVYKSDKENSLQFIGEDEIDHTPKDEKINFCIGNAFDIVGEKIVIDRKRITSNVKEETYKIILKNHKDEDIEILVVEPQQQYWEIMNTTHDYQKKDADTIEFKIKVKKGGEEIIKYTVRYND